MLNNRRINSLGTQRRPKDSTGSNHCEVSNPKGLTSIYVADNLYMSLLMIYFYVKVNTVIEGSTFK